MTCFTSDRTNACAFPRAAATVTKNPPVCTGGPEACSHCRFRNPGTSAVISGDRRALHGAEIFRAGLAAHAVDLGFERKLLAFIERTHAGALDGADVHEYVVAAIVRLNEAKTL